MKKILLIASLFITLLTANVITDVAKHEAKSSVKDKTSIKDKSKKDVLDLDKKQKKMERKVKTKALKAVI